MKKIVVLLLAFSCLLAACSTGTALPTENSAPLLQSAPEKVESTPVTSTKPQTGTIPPVSVPTATETPQIPVVPEQPPVTTPATAPSVPPQTTRPIVPSTQPQTPLATPPATQPVTPPATQPVTPPTTQPAQPSVPGRPTSSATCKDTGSDEIWENPAGYQKDYYEESDPNRTAYLQFLQQENPAYFYWLIEDSMRMYLGRTYGMPLYTSCSYFQISDWVSSDPSVATVNEVGFVVPLKEGMTFITVTCIDPVNDEVLTRDCLVTVVHSTEYTFAELEQRAHEEARLIADYAMNYENATTDLERIAIAAALVHAYVQEGNYGTKVEIIDGEFVNVRIPGYNQPFGTLVTFYSTCAGSTRAMGLVLEYMGFEWYHMGEGKNSHQWCVVYDVDGQTAFADGSSLGMVGYGTWQGDGSNWRQFQNGQLTAVPANTVSFIQSQTTLP